MAEEKEQPERRIHSTPGAMRENHGLSLIVVYTHVTDPHLKKIHEQFHRAGKK